MRRKIRWMVAAAYLSAAAFLGVCSVRTIDLEAAANEHRFFGNENQRLVMLLTLAMLVCLFLAAWAALGGDNEDQ